MYVQRQLELIIQGKIALAVDIYLDGDWSRVATLFKLPRSVLDAWADSVQLPYGRVFREKGDLDGVYVLQDALGWLVLKREAGILLPSTRIYATYKQAKREALAWEFRDALRGAG